MGQNLLTSEPCTRHYAVTDSNESEAGHRQVPIVVKDDAAEPTTVSNVIDSHEADVK